MDVPVCKKDNVENTKPNTEISCPKTNDEVEVDGDKIVNLSNDVDNKTENNINELNEQKISTKSEVTSKLIDKDELCVQNDNDLSLERIETESEPEISDIIIKPDTDQTVILNYVERLQKYVKKQNKKIKKLKNKLKYYKTKFKSNVSVDAATQVYNEEEKPKTIAEEIKKAAEEAVSQSTFVYEATSGMYYDYSTGYYYNAEYGLYYDGNKGIYLQYDDKTKTYHFHSQVEVPLVEQNEKPCGKRKKTTESQGPRVPKQPKPNDDNLEDGECSSSDSEGIENEEVISDSDSEDDDAKEAAGENCAPCVRLIIRETETPNKTVKPGQLHVIPIDGGTLGREGDHRVLLREVSVSRLHAKFTYDGDKQKYSVQDFKSRNGTWLDGVKLEEGNPSEIKHGSVLKCGGVTLLCHVHEGRRTCGHCEPGLLVQDQEKPVEVSKTKKSSHRQELKRLRQKFGLQGEQYAAPKVEEAEGYTNKAEHRRKFVGSWGIYEKTEVTSVEDKIKSSNKGFKMLAKMGWSEGESLGKKGDGLTEPILAVANQGGAGLGCTEPVAPSNPKPDSKTEVWLKTRERYDKLPALQSHPVFAEDSSEEDEEITEKSNNSATQELSVKEP